MAEPLRSVSEKRARSGKPSQRLSGVERRKQIIEVARGAFARSGYHGTTTLEIARQARVSEALVLKYFGTKEQLFRSAVVEPLLEILAWSTETNVRMLEGGSSVEQDVDIMTRILRDWAAVIRDERQLLETSIRELRDFPDVAAEVTRLLQSHITKLAETGQRVVDASPSYRRVDAKVGAYMTLAAATLAAFVADDVERFTQEAASILLLGFLSDSGRAEVARLLDGGT